MCSAVQSSISYQKLGAVMESALSIVLLMLGPWLSGTPLKRTPLGPKTLSILKGCPLLMGYVSHTLSNYWVWSPGSSVKLRCI